MIVDPARLNAGPQPVTNCPGVFRFEDCCNVYALVADRQALLFDLGSGAILERLADLGVTQIQGVYFTHAHRDQCQGAALALERGIPLHFPADAYDFVDRGRRRDLSPPSPLLRSYLGRFEPPRPLEGVEYDVRAPSRLPYADTELEVIAAPGHLDHQVAYLVDWHGRRLCFAGDAMHSAGKVHEAYHLETDHYTGAGARVGRETLRALRQQRPDVWLPSHGPVTDGGLWASLRETERRLDALAELKDSILPGRPAIQRLVRPVQNQLTQVSDHLYLWNNSYFLLSDEGPVLATDPQVDYPESFWEQWRAELGDRRIETVLITHVHCDHVDGVEPLRRRMPIEVWAHEMVAEVVEQPYRLRRPWQPAQPTPVDRRLGEGEAFSWREYDFTAHHFPGQTDYHACYPVAIDGHRAILAGDNFYPPQQWGGTGGLCGLNGGLPDQWRRSIQFIMAREPEWILASHIQPFPYRRQDWEAMLQWCDDVTAAMVALAPDGCLERHHWQHLFALEPYARFAEPGERLTYQLRVANPYPETRRMTACPVVEPDWSVEPKTLEFDAQPGETATAEFSVVVAEETMPAMVTVDLCFGDEYLGEKVEAYVYPR